MRTRGSLMRWVRALAANLVRSSRRDRELRADIDSYLNLLTDEKIAEGLASDAARRAALREFGSVNTVTDDTRRVRAGALLAECAQDARYAWRMIRRDVGFSIVAMLTLALGIGANTAIFSVINAVLLEPLPYSDPDRLVLAWERNTGIGKDRDPVAPPNYQDWRAQNTTFDDLGAYRFRSFALGNVPDPEQLTALALSTSVFRVLRANAEVGRAFTEEEERRHEPVVVLSHQYWQRRFAGDRAVLGRSITLNGASFTIVGIMPARFQFPDGNPVDLYTPLLFTPNELDRRSHILTVIGRLKDGVTAESAQADLGTIAQRIAAEDATSNPDVTIAGAHDVLVEDVRLALMILLGTVGCVLLIACANAANRRSRWVGETSWFQRRGETGDDPALPAVPVRRHDARCPQQPRTDGAFHRYQSRRSRDRFPAAGLSSPDHGRVARRLGGAASFHHAAARGIRRGCARARTAAKFSKSRRRSCSPVGVDSRQHLMRSPSARATRRSLHTDTAHTADAAFPRRAPMMRVASANVRSRADGNWPLPSGRSAPLLLRKT